MTIRCLHCNSKDQTVFDLVKKCKRVGGVCRAPIQATPAQLDEWQWPTGRPPPVDRIKLQKAEFDACDELAKQMRRINLTPIVDDDYPEVRHGYEAALRAFLTACSANGRTL